MTAPITHPDGPAVLVDNVVKSFPKKRPLADIARHPFAWGEKVPALRGVSFAIPRGNLVGLLGPNGAGKTTLLKILCGLVLPDGGRAEVLGVRAGSSALASVLGLVHGEERSFYWRLTARENLEFFARLHHLAGRSRSGRVDELLRRVKLDKDADRRFGDFSSGMRQRLAIARALLADPPVLLMDEPTRSLDPVSAGEQRDWIRDELHGRLGKTVLLATHNLREAESLCDRVVVIARGEVRADAPPQELRRRGLGGVVYALRWRGTAPAAWSAGTLVENLPAQDGTAGALLRLHAADGLDALVEELRAAGGRLVSCGPEEADLETIFRRLVVTDPAPEPA